MIHVDGDRVFGRDRLCHILRASKYSALVLRCKADWYERSEMKKISCLIAIVAPHMLSHNSYYHDTHVGLNNTHQIAKHVERKSPGRFHILIYLLYLAQIMLILMCQQFGLHVKPLV